MQASHIISVKMDNYEKEHKGLFEIPFFQLPPKGGGGGGGAYLKEGVYFFEISSNLWILIFYQTTLAKSISSHEPHYPSFSCIKGNVGFKFSIFSHHAIHLHCVQLEQFAA